LCSPRRMSWVSQAKELTLALEKDRSLIINTVTSHLHTELSTVAVVHTANLGGVV
ncbi:Hypothetical predicted protein, partial [Marmota monax]